MSRTWRRGLTVTLTGAGAAAWWFLGYNWLLQQPPGYRMASAFITVAVAAGSLHFIAFLRFHRMARLIRQAERAGVAAKGSELVAVNQRFRYTTRTLEALWVVGLGVLGLLAVADPSIQLSPNYGRYVLTYFFGSVILTGYLTWRDLAVVRAVQQIDAEARAAQFGVVERG